MVLQSFIESILLDKEDGTERTVEGRRGWHVCRDTEARVRSSPGGFSGAAWLEAAGWRDGPGQLTWQLASFLWKVMDGEPLDRWKQGVRFVQRGCNA